MLIYTVLSFLFLSLYIFSVFYWLKGWRKLQDFSNTDNCDIQLSVIIPYRNEAKNLPKLINSLLNQTISNDRVEFIFVNDHSIDNGEDMVLNASNEHSAVVSMKLDINELGKKTAIAKGIAQSRFKIIVTIDADCEPLPSWLTSIASYWNMYSPKLLVGPVVMRGNKSFFQSFQQLEFMSLVSASAGSLGQGRPLMCNGANLSFEKKVYLESAFLLNIEIASGDDVFLMMAVSKQYDGGVHFLKSKDAVVYTQVSSTIVEFIRQRMRWTSKAPYYSDFYIIYTSLLVFLLSFSITVSFLMGFYDVFYFKLCLLLIVFKSILDYVFLKSTIRFFGLKQLLIWFFPTQFFYHFYISFVVLTGIWGKYTWKNRKH